MTKTFRTIIATKIAEFEIHWTQFLDPHGETVQALPAFAQDLEELKRLYRHLVLTRTFDAKAIALQRTGQLGTYASSLGQEAISIGVAAAMDND
ncbi:MAG: thiamine pyrophosphate-dependent enzyme, partial [Rhodospirillales bacterium]